MEKKAIVKENGAEVVEGIEVEFPDEYGNVKYILINDNIYVNIDRKAKCLSSETK